MVVGKCRLCLSTKLDCLPIFQSLIALHGNCPVPLSVKIAVCISVPINQGDTFSQSICTKCSTLVHQFYAFREKCLNNYVQLLNSPTTDVNSARDIENEGITMNTCDTHVTSLSVDDESNILRLDGDVANNLENTPGVTDRLSAQDDDDPTSYEEEDDPNLGASAVTVHAEDCENLGEDIILHDDDDASKDMDSVISNEDYEEEIDPEARYSSNSDAGEEIVTLTVAHQQEGDTDSFQFIEVKTEQSYGKEYETYINLIRVKEKPISSKISSRYKSCKECHEIFLSANALNIHQKTCFQEQEESTNVEGDIIEYNNEEIENVSGETIENRVFDSKNVEMVDVKSENDSRLTRENTDETIKDKLDEAQTFLIDTTGLLQEDKLPLAKRGKGRCHYCCVCSKFFKTPTSLRNHMRVHSGDKPFVCSTCPRSFSQVGSLRLHERAHNQDYSHVCTDCGKGFFRPSDLEKHVRTHTDTRPFQCSVCNKGFHQMSGLVVHERIHSGVRPHTCNICQMTFSQLSNKYRHMKTHAGGSKPFNCVICHRKFADRDELQMHQTAAHYGGKPRVCTLCGKAYKKQYQLRDHMQRVHTNEQNHVCELCNKAFFKSQELKNHLLIHTGERPVFPCISCPQTFTQAGNLKRHLKLHKDYTVETTLEDNNIMYVESMEMEDLDILQFNDVTE